MLTLLGTTAAIAHKAIDWIPEAPKRRSEPVERPDGKRPRVQGDEGNSLSVEQSAGTARQDQHNVANPVTTFQQAAPIPHTQEAYGYATGNSTGKGR